MKMTRNVSSNYSNASPSEIVMALRKNDEHAENVKFHFLHVVFQGHSIRIVSLNIFFLFSNVRSILCFLFSYCDNVRFVMIFLWRFSLPCEVPRLDSCFTTWQISFLVIWFALTAIAKQIIFTLKMRWRKLCEFLHETSTKRFFIYLLRWGLLLYRRHDTFCYGVN